MAFKNLHYGVNLLKDFPGYCNGFKIELEDEYAFCADPSKWSITLKGKDITKQCYIFFLHVNCIILHTKTPFKIERDTDIRINVPVTKLDTDSTVSTQIYLKLTQHLKMLMADVRDFPSCDSVVIPTIPQPSSSDLAYYDASEEGNMVKMEIYTGLIEDTQTIFSCYVPVCDSTNTTAVPSDFVINKSLGTGIKTMMGDLFSAKAIRISDNDETVTKVIALPQDNQLVDIDGKRYMLVRFAFGYDFASQDINDTLLYYHNYKVYLMFFN